jgi:hypothetical protein
LALGRPFDENPTAVRRECKRLDAEMRMSRYQGQKPPDQTTQRPENGLNHFDVER